MEYAIAGLLIIFAILMYILLGRKFYPREDKEELERYINRTTTAGLIAITIVLLAFTFLIIFN